MPLEALNCTRAILLLVLLLLLLVLLPLLLLLAAAAAASSNLGNIRGGPVLLTNGCWK